MKVLFLLPYPLRQAPSQRFRVEAFFNLLKIQQIHFDTHVFLDDNAWKVLYKGGSSFQKALAVIKGFLRRTLKVLFQSYKYDYIFVHREASPIGPPVFEWILAKVFRKRLIYDFDDAIWIPNVTESNELAGKVKCFWKIKYICKWSYKISVGNAYLANYALKYQGRPEHVFVIPTCVDTANRFNQLKQQYVDEKVVIGWTGSHSTLPYLDIVYPVLERLEKECNSEVLVICNQPPKFSLSSLQFIQWKEETEIEDLLRIHIGIMPLVQDVWSEGKCGFKIIQYLALGIPAVASPVGVNKNIVEQGRSGFLCTTQEEWYQALRLLINEARLRQQFGEAGRKKMVNQFSIAANADKFISLFS